MTSHVTPTRAAASSQCRTRTTISTGSDSHVIFGTVSGASPTISQPVANTVTSYSAVVNRGRNEMWMSRITSVWTFGMRVVAYRGPSVSRVPNVASRRMRMRSAVCQTPNRNAARGTKVSQYVTATESAA